MLTDFYPGTTKSWRLSITLNGTAPDIRADTVTFTMRSGRYPALGSVVLTKAGDVATEGASGVALFELVPADTSALDSGLYSYDLVWDTAGGDQYVVVAGTMQLLPRVSAP